MISGLEAHFRARRQRISTNIHDPRGFRAVP